MNMCAFCNKELHTILWCCEEMLCGPCYGRHLYESHNNAP